MLPAVTTEHIGCFELCPDTMTISRSFTSPISGANSFSRTRFAAGNVSAFSMDPAWFPRTLAHSTLSGVAFLDMGFQTATSNTDKPCRRFVVSKSNASERAMIARPSESVQGDFQHLPNSILSCEYSRESSNHLLIWFRHFTQRKMPLFLSLVTLAAGSPAAETSMPPLAPPPITGEQRIRLFAWAKELCPQTPDRSNELDSTEGYHITLGSKDMDRAQNLLSEGRNEEVREILCGVLTNRVRALDISHPRSIVVLNAFGVLLRKQGESSRARRLFEDVDEIAESYPPEGMTLRRAILHNLGTALYSQGYMPESESVFRRALRLSEQAGDYGSQSVASTLTNLAFALEAQHRYEDAEEFHRRALTIREGKESRSPLERAATLNNLGANLTAQGNLSGATPLLKEGLFIRKMLLSDANLNIGFSLANLSTNLLALGRTNEARTLARELVALRRSNLGDMHPETAIALQLLGRANLESGDFEGALEASRLAIAARLPLSLREEMAISEDARFASRTALSSAAFVIARANWSASRASPKSWPTYAVPASAAEAFLAAQRTSVSGTADAFLRAGAQAHSSDDDMGEVARALARAQDALSNADQDIVTALSRGGAVGALQAKRVILERTVAELERDFSERYPAFFELARPEPTGLERLSGDAGLLRPEEVLILLTPGTAKHNGLVWAISRERGAWAEIPIKADELLAKIMSLRQQLDLASGYSLKSPRHYQASPAAFDRSLARELYQGLFGSPQIAAIVSKKSHWILVPQGALLSLPFSTLIAEPISGAASGDHDPDALRATKWLGIARVLTMLPSITSLNLRTARRPAAAKSNAKAFFGIGDPSFNGQIGDRPREISNYFDSRSGRAERIRDLPALPDTRIEIEKLATILGAARNDYLLGDEATESELQRRNAIGELGKARIIAFATHGLISGELRNSLVEPALALTPPTQSTPYDDGLLTASEVARLSLNADWILLSACNTAAPSSTSTEGLTGLARAFFVAGGQSLLVSHWRVRDDVAARITVRAVELSYGTRGMQRPDALHAAMRDLIADKSADASEISFSHPAIWAPFMLVGSY